jgi:hypothetical protein
MGAIETAISARPKRPSPFQLSFEFTPITDFRPQKIATPARIVN